MAHINGELVDDSEIEERAGLAADRVPLCYLDAWARIDCQRPSHATEEAWRRATNDAGQFLDTWGALAAELGWTAGELFDVPYDARPGGLVWQLNGERVEALGADRARLSCGRTFERGSQQSPHVSTGLRQAERI